MLRFAIEPSTTLGTCELVDKETAHGQPLPERCGLDITKDIDVAARESRPGRWRDIWRAVHSASGVTRVLPVAELIRETEAEYRAA